jgi:hypothetical protein
LTETAATPVRENAEYRGEATPQPTKRKLPNQTTRQLPNQTHLRKRKNTWGPDMDDIESKRRRELLVGAGAILANASVPGRAAFAQSSPVKHGKRGRANGRHHSIAPDLKNTYFKAQGGPSSSSSTSALLLARNQSPAQSAAVLGAAASAAPGTSTLVLYDTTGPFGWLGELYAIMTLNLASHFGSWTAMPPSQQ